MFYTCRKTLTNVNCIRFSNTYRIYERRMSCGLCNIDDRLAGYIGEVCSHPRPTDSIDSSHGIIAARWQDSSTDPEGREKMLQML